MSDLAIDVVVIGLGAHELCELTPELNRHPVVVAKQVS